MLIGINMFIKWNISIKNKGSLSVNEVRDSTGQNSFWLYQTTKESFEV